MLALDFSLSGSGPLRLVAVDVESPRVADTRLAQSAAEPGYGPDGSFEAVFLLARSQLKRALRRFSFPEAARVLVPGGLLVVMYLARARALSAAIEPHPLRGRVCIYDAGAMRRWKEVEPPEKVVEQARKGGLLED